MAELDRLLGLHTPALELTWLQIGLRTAIVFVWGLLLVRLADRRFLGRIAGFDVLLGIVLGSVLSRGINGQAPFLPTLAASGLLVGLHRLVAMTAARWSWFSRLVKGQPVTLVRDGRLLETALDRCDITRDDLDENLRISGSVRDPAEVAEARLERNGEVSVVKRIAPDTGKPDIAGL